MMCRLSLFGPPRLLDDQDNLIPVPAKTFPLVAYLVLTNRGEPATRASLRQFLWEESEAKAAATNLRKLLSRIIDRQQTAGVAIIRSRRDHVELARASVQIDLADFLRMIGSDSPADLATLCDLYRGDLLEGVEWGGTDPRNWLDVQRAQLRDAFIGALTKRLEAGDADAVQVRIAARRLLEVDPYNEIAHRVLMRLYAEDSEPARVRDLYRNLEQRLRDDLGVEPNAATTALYHSLMPGRRKGAQPVAAAVEPAVPAAMTQQDEPPRAESMAADISNKSGAPRITVLPPPPIAGLDYSHQLALSLIEDVTIGLCRTKSLSVVAPHTAWELSQNGKKTLFKAFAIDYAVETQLHNRGGELWLSLKLLDAVSREIRWTEQYSLNKDQVARRYRELSVRILSSLIERVERTELARYDQEQNPTAYRLYLIGQRHLKGLDLPHVRRARRAFKMALVGCPNFVPAICGLGQTYHMEWLLMARGDVELLTDAQRLAERALEIDPDDARGYRNLGLCRLYGGHFGESLEAFGQAERRNPQHADLLVDFADALQHACEPAAALEKINRAIELNPLCPDDYWWVAGGANFHLREYDHAIECMSRMRNNSPALRLMAASWAMLGNREKAAECVKEAKYIHPDFSVETWLSILPIRDPKLARHYEQGLREAGFD